MSFLLVGVGGILGGILRYQIGRSIAAKTDTTFPIGTLVINLIGSFLLGLLTGLAAGGPLYVLLGDGFLGAFTTFSTFTYEGIQMFQKNEMLRAFLYVSTSLLIGVVACAFGMFLGRLCVGLPLAP